ncbi:MAG: DUF456 domain-containing protein [Bacteroidales bacterium]|nr:DUF456 domain-containing protein [Bacteroidales bacterium]
MDVFLPILAVILGLIGIIGSVAPGLPGPPLSWLGLLCLYFAGGTGSSGEPMSTTFLFVWLGITTLVCIVDYVVPAWFTKLTGGSKYAGWGAIAGLFIGMVVPPVGMILGALAGAFLAEWIFASKTAVDSVSSAFGALLGFLFGTGLKLIASGVMFYYIIVYLR